MEPLKEIDISVCEEAVESCYECHTGEIQVYVENVDDYIEEA